MENVPDKDNNLFFVISHNLGNGQFFENVVTFQSTIYCLTRGVRFADVTVCYLHFPFSSLQCPHHHTPQPATITL